MTYILNEALAEHDRRMKDLNLKKSLIDLEINRVQEDAFHKSLGADWHKPYNPVVRQVEWSEFVTDPQELDLHISPTDVLVKVLNTAFKPWYVNSVYYTVDPQMKSLTVNVRFGGTFLWILMMCNPFLFVFLAYILKKRIEKCDLMPEITTLTSLEVDVFWLTPKYGGLDDIRSTDELVGLTLHEDQRLMESYFEKNVAQLPYELTEEEEVSLYV